MKTKSMFQKMLSVVMVAGLLATMLGGCVGSGGNTEGETTAPVQSNRVSETASQTQKTVYPSDLLQYIVAASAGGGLDIVSRAFTTPWEELLGTTFEYVYEDSGSTYLMGMNDLNTFDSDEFGVMIGLPEAMLAMFAYQDSTYTLDDVAWIGNVYTDANCLMVRIDDDRFETASDLIEYARSASVPLVISTPQVLTPANITAQIFVDASGINASVVEYSGGAGARNDLIGGHVDVSVGGISTAIGLTDQVKVIGIFGDHNPVEDIWDCQVVKEFATDFDMPDLTCHCSIWTTRAMKEEHTDIYNLLVDTYEQALQSEAAAKNLITANQDRFIEYFGPEETKDNAAKFMKTLEDYAYLLDPNQG